MTRIAIIDHDEAMVAALRQAFGGTGIDVQTDWKRARRSALAVPATTRGELIIDLPPRPFDAHLHGGVLSYFTTAGPLQIGDYRTFVTGDLLGFPALIVVPIAEQVGTPLTGTGCVQRSFATAIRACREHGFSALTAQAMRTRAEGLDPAFYGQQLRIAFDLSEVEG